jgi:hypothetical protein
MSKTPYIFSHFKFLWPGLNAFIPSMVLVDLEEDEIFFLLACLEEIAGLVVAPILLNQLQTKLAIHCGTLGNYDFSVGYEDLEQVSSLILGYHDLIRCFSVLQVGMTACAEPATRKT